ncbi:MULTISPECIES: fumarylacetoacetate hydrolase family protein [unclassified Xanthobacter]|uniref:fumarylacetoacetate hydrolase family protein n=1 Tax=unclassified Xanthobacter TaxID=2623496 RepID=UPI001EDFF3FA|nr:MULTISPECIES: fumarylacetoacetate hydrolase family protein [unclassified Xanthobacter]
MRLLSYIHNGSASFGLVTTDGIIDLKARLDACPSLDALVARTGGNVRPAVEALAGSVPDVAVDAVEFLPPLAHPNKIICVGLNYQGHMTETGRAPVDYPTLFSRWPDSHVGHGAPMIRPAVSQMFDFEGELAVVIGKAGWRVPAAQAMDHVLGYSCYNDGSIRDFQRHTTQFLPGKNFRASGAFGPWIVLADTVPDYRALTLTTRLNGQVVQQASLAQLIFDLPTLISYISTFTPLEPGDVIVSGTPDGVGAFRQPPLWMQAGDRVEVEVTGIGTLSNPIADEATRAA